MLVRNAYDKMIINAREMMAMFAFNVDDEISLRLLDERYAGELLQLINHSREDLREWLPWLDSTTTPRHVAEFIQGAWMMYEERSGLRLGIFYHGRLAGMVGFNTIDWANRIGIIGYWLGSHFQGYGIMTRSVTAIIDYGFNQLNLNRIEIRAAFQNDKSRAIPERLGFQIEGKIRQGEWLYDHFVDLVMYGMLASEWE
ncbi:GNAT family N-acetyltransferase [Ornithinibacillus sp. 179-J 7C1 HS]|uniref:GNAT family N-acetyltransferase n=1 Tax=Ornithinibacillus sp. 179-J 7C1 HS TaxID=3142384 RepID=UPI0039A0984A